MQLALHLPSIFLNRSGSTTAPSLFHRALEAHISEVTNSASQLLAHHQVGAAQQFPGKCDIIEQLACKAADWAHDDIPNDTSRNVDPEPNFVPTLPDSVRIIACPERYTYH